MFKNMRKEVSSDVNLGLKIKIWDLGG